jgi:hypothetical protein
MVVKKLAGFGILGCNVIIDGKYVQEKEKEMETNS